MFLKSGPISVRIVVWRKKGHCYSRAFLLKRKRRRLKNDSIPVVLASRARFILQGRRLAVDGESRQVSQPQSGVQVLASQTTRACLPGCNKRRGAAITSNSTNSWLLLFPSNISNKRQLIHRPNSKFPRKILWVSKFRKIPILTLVKPTQYEKFKPFF